MSDSTWSDGLKFVERRRYTNAVGNLVVELGNGHVDLMLTYFLDGRVLCDIVKTPFGAFNLIGVGFSTLPLVYYGGNDGRPTDAFLRISPLGQSIELNERNLDVLAGTLPILRITMKGICRILERLNEIKAGRVDNLGWQPLEVVEDPEDPEAIVI